MTPATLAFAIAFAIGHPAPPAGRREASLTPGAGKSFHITQWTLNDGLPQSTVTSITQSRDGYLWLGTFGGLVRFDGVRFKCFSLEQSPGLSTNRIVSLCTDKNDTLWIGTENGGLIRRKGDAFESVVSVHDTGVIWKIVEDGAGDIWVLCNRVGRIHEGHWELADPLHDAGETHFTAMRVDASGRLWLGCEHAVFRQDGERFDAIPIAPLKGDPLAIVTSQSNRTWLIASNGVGYLDEHDACHVVLNEQTTFPARGIVDAQGDLLFSKRNGGLGVIRNNKVLSRVHIESRPESLGNRLGIRSLYRSADGIVWAGTNVGLLRFSAEPYVRVADDIDLGYGARHVVSDRGNGVYVEAESPQRILHWDGQQLRRYEKPSLDGLTKWRIVCGTRSGVIIADEQGLWRLSPEGLEQIDEHPGIHGAFQGADGKLWLLRSGKLAWKRGDESGEIDIPLDAGCTRPSKLFTQTRDGALWFADGLHLVRFDPDETTDRFDSFGIDDGLPQSDIRCVHQDRDGTIWLSTYGQGLYRLRNRAFTEFGTVEGMPDTNLGGILEDDDARLWVNSNRGVLVIPIASLNAVAEGSQKRITCRVLATGEVNGSTACRTPNGRMWFPTIDDLVVVDPTAYHPNDVPPRVVVERVDADGVTAEQEGNFRVAMSGSNIQFAYTAFSYAHPNQLRFRYHLENYDKTWHDVGNRRTAYYTRVPPGDYVFHVMAGNEDGVWSKLGATLPLRIRPQFYETAWFRIGAVLSIVLLLLAAHRQRISTHRRHTAALTAEIEQRERSEIEQRRLEKLLRESTKLEAVGRLAGGIAHDFNNILAAILGSAEVIRLRLSKDDRAAKDKLDVPSPDVIESLDCIAASGQRAAALTKQLLAYSRRQLLRPQVIDANDVITKLRPMLRQLLPDNVELAVSLTDDVASTRVDVTQLEQVVLNLVLNARDAIGSRGMIEIKTNVATLDDADESMSNLRRDVPYVMIAIADTGEGISDEALPHIFEPFYTTRFDQGGAGLGLATVQGVVYQSGGHIVVDNQRDAGTAFKIFLPYAPGGVEEKAEAPPEAVLGGDETILLCEDDDAVRQLARRALERAGYTVLDAAFASKARELASNDQHIDLLITDVVMPIEDGFSLAAAFREMHPNAKTLFVSGYANVAFEMPEMNDGKARFLGKPFLSETLLREVRRILDSD